MPQCQATQQFISRHFLVSRLLQLFCCHNIFQFFSLHPLSIGLHSADSKICITHGVNMIIQNLGLIVASPHMLCSTWWHPHMPLHRSKVCIQSSTMYGFLSLGRERQLCNTVPMELVLLYQVRRKVYTNILTDAVPFQDPDNLDANALD